MIYAKDINFTPKNWRVKKSNAEEFKKRCLRLIKAGLSFEEIFLNLTTTHIAMKKDHLERVI